MNFNRAFLTFGVPGTDKDNGWEGDNILFSTVTIHFNDHSTVSGDGVPLRHQPIGAGVANAVQIGLGFSAADLKKITFDNVWQMDVRFTATPGEGSADNHECRYRTEIVFKDDANHITLASGYSDPARSLITAVIPVSEIIFQRAVWFDHETYSTSG